MTMKIKGKPNIDEFLECGDKATKDITKANSKEACRQKIVRLPIKLLMDIKRYAADETEKSCKSVTETDVIKRALESYIYK